MRYNEDGSIDLANTTYAELAKAHSAKALQYLVEHGGKGLENAMHELIIQTLAKHSLSK